MIDTQYVQINNIPMASYKTTLLLAFYKYSSRGNWLGEIPPPPISTCPSFRKNIFSTIFHDNLNMCFVHTFPMELELTIYYLSPDAFSYVVSTLSTRRV